MIKDVQNIPENGIFNIKDSLNLTYLTSEKCLSLHRTNVRMSGNQKIVYKSDNELYLETINSSDYLNRSFFKGYKIDPNQGYLYNLKQFLTQSSNESAIYEIRDEEELVSKEFSKQYPQLYKWGAYTEVNDVLSNSDKPNSYRFFAPIWTYGTLPDRFLIFRISNQELNSFEDYYKNAVLVHSVSLKDDTTFGRYLRTLTKHESFTDSCIYVNYTDSKIRYNGISYKTGKFNHHTESNLDSFLANERTITEFNNSLTNGWKRGSLICPNLINLEYVFSDTTSLSGFNNYFGVYVWDNEISKYEANRLEKIPNTIVLSEDDTSTILFKTMHNVREELQPYNKTIGVTDATQLEKTILNPIAEITLPYPPIIGTSILIQYNEEVELQIQITKDIYDSSTTTESLQKIADYINETSTPNIIITASVYNNSLVIKSEILDQEYENIKVILPHVFQMKKPKYYSNTQQDDYTFNMVGYSDLMVSEVFWDSASFAEVDNVEYELEKYFTYMGIPILRLKNDFDKVASLQSSTIKIKQVTNPKYYIETIVKHVDFHTTMKESPYYDIWDYDFYEYQYMFGLRLVEYFKKDRDGTISLEELELLHSYRDLFRFNETEPLYTSINDESIIPVRNEALKTFNSKNVLIKTIDAISLIPSEAIKNEFLRLYEETLVEIRNINVLEPKVLKFVNTNGTDSYNNPISLNIDVAHRYDNFQYIASEVSRSNQNHSHQWFILGSGPGIYDKNTQSFLTYLDTVQKQLGYANIPIVENQHHSITINQFNDLFDITNTEIDIYNYLSYRLSNNPDIFYSKHGYMNMFKQSGTSNYNALFRGVEYSITGEFKDYRFSVIMINELTPNAPRTITNQYTLIDNREFKTLTLIVSFRTTDKYITSLNQRSPFYLDRSFLYFTEKFYTSTALSDLDNVEDFEIIDMMLFDDSYNHFYNGEAIQYVKKTPRERETESSITSSNINMWYTIDEQQKPIFSILLGMDSQLSGYSFENMIEKPEKPDDVITFEWVVNSVSSDNNLNIIIRYTAYDIISISDSEIWCRDIFMEFIPSTINLYKNQMLDGEYTEITLNDIILNNKPTLNIGGFEYVIPFWSKIGSSNFCKLPIQDPISTRYGLRLTKEFYEEIIEDRFSYPDKILNSQYIRSNNEGKRFICFDSISYDGDTTTEINKKINLNNRVGYFLEHDQFWFITKDLNKNNASIINTTTARTLSNIEYYGISNLQMVLDLYPIKTIIVDKDTFVETTKKLNILPISETITLLSLEYAEESNSLSRNNDSLISYSIQRQDGNYNPLFNTIVQPFTFRNGAYIYEYERLDDIVNAKIGEIFWIKKLSTLYECISVENGIPELVVSKYNDEIIYLDTFSDIDANIQNRYIGQMVYIKDVDSLYIFYNSVFTSDIQKPYNYDKEYESCLLPKNLNSIWSGRHIATTDSNFDNYCEEFIDNGLRHISNKYYYKAIYDGLEFDVISDASLCEHRNFISSIYNNVSHLEYVYIATGNKINIIDLTIKYFGKYFEKYLDANKVDYEELLHALKLYNKDLNKDNIIFENFYYELYKHHYEEFIHKHYKVSEIITDKGQRIEFIYDNPSQISIDFSKLKSNNLNIKFSKA